MFSNFDTVNTSVTTDVVATDVQRHSVLHS